MKGEKTMAIKWSASASRPTDLTWSDEHSSSYLLREEVFTHLEQTFETAKKKNTNQENSSHGNDPHNEKK